MRYLEGICDGIRGIRRVSSKNPGRHLGRNVAVIRPNPGLLNAFRVFKSYLSKLNAEL